MTDHQGRPVTARHLFESDPANEGIPWKDRERGAYCRWPFHCPTGAQEARIACRACESRR